MPALLIFPKKYIIIIIEKVRKEFSNDFGSAESSGSHFRVLLELRILASPVQWLNSVRKCHVNGNVPSDC